MSDIELLKRAAKSAVRWQSEIGGDVKEAKREINKDRKKRTREFWKMVNEQKKKNRKKGRKKQAS